MAVRNGNRYRPALRASPVTSRPRRFTLVGAANMLELDGASSPERSSSLTLDAAVRIIRPAFLNVDTKADIRSSCAVNADLGIRVRRPYQLETDIAVRSIKPTQWMLDQAIRVTGSVSVRADLREAIGRPAKVNTETTMRIYAILRREDHLILT